MKKIVLILSTLLFAVSINAQNPFKGFFQSTNSAVQNELFIRSNDVKPVILIRTYVSMTASAVQFGGGKPVVNALNSTGIGLTLGKFSDQNGKAYCDWALNGSLLTQVNLNGVQSLTMGGALSVGLFDNVLAVGVGYLDKHPMLLIGVGYNF